MVKPKSEFTMRFAYYYSMKNEPDVIRAVAPRHASYWRERKLAEYLGGPFADRSGGLITFAAESLEDAERVVADDPFVTETLLNGSVLKEWTPQ